MKPLRDTQARLRKRINFFIVEGGVLILVATAAVSGLMLTIVSNRGSLLLDIVAALPFSLTFLYLLIFKTGRRPNFDRDLLNLFLNGKSISPPPPSKQPRNPGYADD